MKKKDRKKLILNTAFFASVVLMLIVVLGFILLINQLTHVVVNNKADVIGYKQTAGYLYIIAAILFLGMDCFIPYGFVYKKFNADKKNQKIPSHRKPGKGEGTLKVIKTGFIILNAFLILAAFPICINARWELHSDGIYKIAVTGKEKLVCSADEIIRYKVESGKSRNSRSSHTNYYLQVIAETEGKNYYIQNYKNQQVKKDFFLYLKNKSETEINVYELQKYYDRFSDENKMLVDLLIGK